MQTEVKLYRQFHFTSPVPMNFQIRFPHLVLIEMVFFFFDNITTNRLVVISGRLSNITSEKKEVTTYKQNKSLQPTHDTTARNSNR